MKQFSKLAFFDFDGTLTDENEFVYTSLWKYFDISSEKDSADFERFKRKEITYVEWVNRDIKRFQAVDATREKFLQAFKPIKPMLGAEELLRELKQRGFGIIVVSGGIHTLVEVIFPRYQELFDEIFINRYHFDADGRLIGATPTPYDFKDKDTCIRDMAKKYNIPLSKTIFVGDNMNDIEAAQTAGVSFAFNTDKPSLIAVATHHIKVKDLREILKYL